MLDSKLNLLRFHFGIQKPEDWTHIRPNEVLSQDGIGDATLNHLRYLLAGQGLTLLDDQTPDYWQSRLIRTKLGTFVHADKDRSVMCQFTIVIDAQEKIPFTFTGFTATEDGEEKPLIIPTVRRTLGPTHGDYTIEGHEGECHVERKSIDDCIGTVLGWGDRRERFVRTLQFLSSCKSAAIVVEGSLGSVIREVRETRGKTRQTNQKILHRQILAWMTDFPVPWIFSDTPRFAEKNTFYVLRRHYKKAIEEKKKS